MKKSIVILFHAGFWLCYFFLIIVILGLFYGSKQNVQSQQIVETCKIIVCFAVIPSVLSFYGYYYLIFEKYIVNKKTLKAIAYCIIISVAAGNIGFILLNLLNEKDCEPSNFFVGITLFISFIATLSGVVALIMQGFFTWIREIKLKEELSNKNNEMEMALVKSQLDPHFLFNTINNIDVLILKNAVEASNYLNKLSDIMRFILYETKSDKILLSKELIYIEKYIELQKIRTSNSSFVTFSVVGKPNSLIIAPMIFIPFIENAFKHSTNKKVKNAIIINVVITNEAITLVCSNKFRLISDFNSDYNGLGNELIEKRLRLIYKTNFKLEIEIIEDVYCVKLKLPTHE